MPHAPVSTEIRCLCLDVDGVLTDGSIYTDHEGHQMRVFHVHDGIALRWFQEQGGTVVLCSGKNVPAVDARARELQIQHVIQGSRDKRADLNQRLGELGLSFDQLAMIGDDLPDIPVMRVCRLPIAVANAASEVKSVAKVVTRASGGRGAVREAVELIMRRDGAWSRVLEAYGA